METKDRYVAQTTLDDGTFISTVFLGIDHRFCDDGSPPILFETMIFGGPRDQQYMRRCETWEQAELHHAEAVEYARNHMSYWRKFWRTLAAGNKIKLVM